MSSAYKKKVFEVIIIFSLLIIFGIFIISAQTTTDNKPSTTTTGSDSKTSTTQSSGSGSILGALGSLWGSSTKGLEKDSSGKIISADYTVTNANGEKLIIGGKEFYVPKGGRVQMSKGDNEIKVSLPNDAKIKEEVKVNNSLENKVIKYIVDQNSNAELPNGMKFKGTLSSDGKSWFIDKGNEVTLNNVKLNNIYGKATNLDEKLRIYLNEGKYDGNYVYFGEKKIITGSTTALDGHSIEFLEGNPYVSIDKNSHMAIEALGNSASKIENGKLTTVGSVIVDEDAKSFLMSDKQGGKLFTKDSVGIPGYNNNDYKGKNNAKIEFIPFKADGSPVSVNSQKLILDEKTGFQIVAMAQTDKDIGRLKSNQAPVDSRGNTVVPITPPSGNKPPEFIKPSDNIQGNALSSTVRISAQDPSGSSVGTGTIIGEKDGRAIVITAGHIFRDSKGQGVVNVDLFDANSNQVKTVQGQVIDYQIDTGKGDDIAIVSIPKTDGMSVTKVASNDYTPKVGDPVFNTGCAGGANPTCQTGSVASIGKYLNPASGMTVSGEFQQGRSGGGLFTNTGKLIGVLSASDKSEGHFNDIKTIQQYLDKKGLSNLYKLLLIIYKINLIYIKSN